MLRHHPTDNALRRRSRGVRYVERPGLGLSTPPSMSLRRTSAAPFFRVAEGPMWPRRGSVPKIFPVAGRRPCAVGQKWASDTRDGRPPTATVGPPNVGTTTLGRAGRTAGAAGKCRQSTSNRRPAAVVADSVFRGWSPGEPRRGSVRRQSASSPVFPPLVSRFQRIRQRGSPFAAESQLSTIVGHRVPSNERSFSSVSRSDCIHRKNRHSSVLVVR